MSNTIITTTNNNSDLTITASLPPPTNPNNNKQQQQPPKHHHHQQSTQSLSNFIYHLEQAIKSLGSGCIIAVLFLIFIILLLMLLIVKSEHVFTNNDSDTQQIQFKKPTTTNNNKPRLKGTIKPFCPFDAYPPITHMKDIKTHPYPRRGDGDNAVNIYKPHMTEIETNYFIETIKQFNNYFEFGSGGSTGLASFETNLQSIITVDTDMRFAATIHDRNVKNVQAYWINIGPVREWGIPDPDRLDINTCFHTWPRFALSYHILRKPNTDIVLVDGRFRISCVLSVLLTGDRPHFLIHDYIGDDRPYYKVILLVLDQIECKGSLCFFSVKENLDMAIIIEQYIQYMSNWDM
jgi:hypothetical protein